MRALLILAGFLASLTSSYSAVIVNSHRFGPPPVPGPQPSFYWSFESWTPEKSTHTSALDSTNPLTLTTDRALTGSYSGRTSTLSHSGRRFHNDTNEDRFANKNKGYAEWWYYHNGTWDVAMHFQMDGKTSVTLPDDTNDSIGVFFSGSSSLNFKWNVDLGGTVNFTVPQLDRSIGWHKVRIWWDRAGVRKLAMKIDDEPTIWTTTDPGELTCTTFHQIYVGNDASVGHQHEMEDFKVFIDDVPDPTVFATQATALVAQQAEGSTPPGWVDVGSPNWNDTANALKGASSLSLTSATQSTTKIFPSSPVVWVRVRWKAATLIGDPWIVRLIDGSGNPACTLYALSTGSLRLTDPDGGTQGTSTSGMVVAGTSYTFWLRVEKGTGADATYGFFMDSGTNRPGQPVSSWRMAGELTNDIAGVQFLGRASNTITIDDIFVATDEIPSGEVSP